MATAFARRARSCQAAVAARELLNEAEIRKRANLPVVTRRFRGVALLAIQRMKDEATSGKGKVSYADYITIINEYLIPTLGKRIWRLFEAVI